MLRIVLFAALALVPSANAVSRVGAEPAAAAKLEPPTVQAFDTTAYIADPGWFRGMAARGYRLYIMHSTSWGTCIPWPEAQRQAADALAAGLAIAAYTRDPRCWSNGIAALGSLASSLQFFALDVETDPGVPVTPAMVSGVRSAGVRPVIYSGSAMWPEIQGGDDQRFADLPLWDASSGSPVAFGGWNTPGNPRLMTQTALGVTIDGITVDLDTISASMLRGAPGGGESGL
jgi:hypothetical protein